ncbi:MAG TPA: PHP domain-containing protein, partial [Ornithinibacter sp.]|nr:PHP domain-containing protein [Ornithinibacter sp.]
MPTDPFVHLHVASGYSLRHGASHPGALVARAAELGMGALALTDRDGVRGAVKFAKSCLVHGLAPILGADLAVTPDDDSAAAGHRPNRRLPARGGAVVDPRHPRVTVLARGGPLTPVRPGGGVPTGAGWAALNRLVSATHLGTGEAPGERGRPVSSRELVAQHAESGGLVVLLGPDSEVGRALAVRRPDLARVALDRWQEVVAPALLRIEVVSHRGPGSGLGSSVLAARLLSFARDQGLEAVLTNTVRYADPSGAATSDLLDSARRLVALDLRHVDRVNAEGFLKPGAAMTQVAVEVARLAGGAGDTEATCVRRLLDATAALAADCVLDPARDLGLGAVHLPELAVVDASGRPAPVVLRERCEAGLAVRYPGGARLRRAAQVRLDDELAVIGTLGYETYFLTVAEVCALTRSLGVRAAARGSGAGSLVLHVLGVSGVEPLRHGLLMERFLTPLRQALPDVDIDVESARRGEVYDAVLDRFGGDRCVCVSMMDTYRVRHAVRDVGAALGLPPGEVDAIAKAFPHIRARDARAALADLPELRASRLGAGGAQGLDTFFGLVESLDGLPRHVALHPCGV